MPEQLLDWKGIWEEFDAEWDRLREESADFIDTKPIVERIVEKRVAERDARIRLAWGLPE